LDEDDRLSHHKGYSYPQAGYELSIPILTFIKYFSMVHSGQFHAYVSCIYGDTLTKTLQSGLNMVARNDHIIIHSDSSGKLQSGGLCAVLYVNDNWESRFGGQMIMHGPDGMTDYIAPITNRLLIFDPVVNMGHEVEPLTDQAGDWFRATSTIWIAK
jgi:Rps23 Pro-64 3,4-dihydroxylase Tpa1-like proline 4-hydroxylase